MTHEELMMQAIGEAKKSEEPLRCGVVITKDGEIIAMTHNEQRKTNNPTAHAEVLALKEAGQKLGRKNLDDCVAYCSCEPCTMCLSALIFAKIPTIYFGTTIREASPDHMPIALTTEQLLATVGNSPRMIGGFLKTESEALLRTV